MPPPVESLIQAASHSHSHYSPTSGISAAALVSFMTTSGDSSSSTSTGTTRAESSSKSQQYLQQQQSIGGSTCSAAAANALLHNSNSSSVNWHNYFNTKSSKDNKLTVSPHTHPSKMQIYSIFVLSLNTVRFISLRTEVF